MIIHIDKNRVAHPSEVGHSSGHNTGTYSMNINVCPELEPCSDFPKCPTCETYPPRMKLQKLTTISKTGVRLGGSHSGFYSMYLYVMVLV